MAKTSFFRPVFTQRLLQRLKAGEVINLVGNDRQGIGRVLEDIQRQNEDGQENILLLNTDLSLFREDYLRLLEGLSQAVGLPERVEEIGEWIEVVKLSGVPVLIFFHHFDAVYESYPSQFFEQLNGFLLAPRLSLLCVTKKPIEMDIKNLDAFAGLGQFQPEVVKLPPIAYKRIKEELLRTQPQLDNWNPLASAIFSQQDLYGFLQFVVKKLEKLDLGQLEEIESYIQPWLNEFHGKTVSEDEPKKKGLFQRLFGSLFN